VEVKTLLKKLAVNGKPEETTREEQNGGGKGFKRGVGERFYYPSTATSRPPQQGRIQGGGGGRKAKETGGTPPAIHPQDVERANEACVGGGQKRKGVTGDRVEKNKAYRTILHGVGP